MGLQRTTLDQLEPLLKILYFLSPGWLKIVSPGWLKIDPHFDPLRKNPRFQKLIALPLGH